MDAYEVTRMVYARVQAMEPEMGSKVMGYFLLQDDGEQEMLRLAFAPDSLLISFIFKAKQQLGLLPPISATNGAAPPAQRLSSATDLFHKPPPSPTTSSPILPYHHHLRHPFPSPELLPDPFPFLSDPPDPPPRHQIPHSTFPPPPPDFLSLLSSSPDHPSSSSLSDLPISPDSSGLSPAWKPCLYYARGYCKHGSNCRFLHSHVRSDPVSPTFLHNSQRDNRSDDGLGPGSLDRLGMELQELLRGRRAPVSIASLPQLYYERFGKTLQAEGYLTESQRHGRAGFSLTKLLARLKNTVTLIDRGGKDDLSGVNPGSRQIYLTFPAESTFTEEDVSAHFRAYGPVQDVRIPYQQKRMFGFVTFVYPETVKAILAKGNPHYICGARVLVKPYREKGKHSDKKLPDRGEHSRFAPSRSFDGREFTFHPGLHFFDDHDLLRRQINEQELQAFELEKIRFAELRSADSSTLFAESEASTVGSGQGRHGHVSNGLASPGEMARSTAEDISHLQDSSAFGYLLDVLDGDPAEDLNPQVKADNDQPSDGHNLPDSPFASPHAETNIKPSFLAEKINSFSFGVQALMPGSPISASTFSEDDKELTCRICMGFFVDPIRLDCNHMFCVQCVLKVIRISKDECPVCRRHIGTQIVKLLESRGLQVIEPMLTKPRELTQAKWPAEYSTATHTEA